jgi:hypothetical protein
MKEYKVSTTQFTAESSSLHLVGIDTGITTGISIYSADTDRFVFCKCFDWWDLIEFLNEKIFGTNGASIQPWFHIVIEDVIANKPTFNKGMIWAAIVTNNKPRIAQSIGIFDKIAQDVGGNKRDERHLLELFERAGVCVHTYAPKKHSKTKMKRAEFTQETGITSRLNEHTRDATMLVRYHISRSGSISTPSIRSNS